jgi:hypothetical protein
MALLDSQTRSNPTDWYRSRSHQPLRIDCRPEAGYEPHDGAVQSDNSTGNLSELKTGHHDLEIAARMRDTHRVLKGVRIVCHRRLLQ